MVQAVQVPSNTTEAFLYVTERNFDAKPGHRMYARSFDGGQTLTDFGIDNSLVEPVTPHWTGIVAAVQRLSFSPDRIVLSLPGDAGQRANLTMRVSHDSGHSWSPARTFWPGLGGYTDTVLINNVSLGVIFENGDSTFSDRISFTALPLLWFEGL